MDRSMKKHYIVNMYPTQGNSKRISVGYYWQELLQTIIIFVATKVLRRGVNKQGVPEIQNVTSPRVYAVRKAPKLDRPMKKRRVAKTG